MKRLFGIVVWLGVVLLGAGAFGKIAFDRGEPLNATWFVVAAVCCYLVASFWCEPARAREDQCSC